MGEVAVVDTGTGEIVEPGVFDKAQVSSTSLVIDDHVTYEEWERIGEQLKLMERSVLWWIGDWLNFGEARYGETYSQALETTDKSYQQLADAKWVASKIEPSCRHENLSFTHHREALGSDEPEAVLVWADEEGASVKELRNHVRDAKRGIRHQVQPPTGEYSVIYADPPWAYEFSRSESRSLDNQYPTMELEAICKLHVPAAADAVLFLWATSPKLDEAFSVIERWGFEYKTCAVWDKAKIGMGYYFRQQHELLLVATKGSPPESMPEARAPSVFTSPRGEHSKKPEYVYSLIEGMYPSLPKIELFCREPREGWAAWGNQVGA